MQSSGTTDDLEPGDGRHDSEPATAPLEVPRSPASDPTLSHVPVSASRDQCGSCGAQLAPDQRYCVECGQRRGRSRVEFMEQLAPRAAAPPAPPRRRLPRVSANAALIAAVGTLILAMGVGVLIGRAASGEKSGGERIKVVTLGGGTGTAASTTAPTTPTTPTTGTESTTTGSGSPTTGSSAAKSTAKSKTTTGKAAAKSKPRGKAVKIGSHGSGAGYNKKKEFTGEFFGKGEE